jgi:PDZ domain-containing secreted protein
LSLGCEYSGTEEVVSEIVYETLESMDKSGMKTAMRTADEIGLVDGKEFATLDDFVRIFWEKAVEKILDIVETQ